MCGEKRRTLPACLTGIYSWIEAWRTFCWMQNTCTSCWRHWYSRPCVIMPQFCLNLCSSSTSFGRRLIALGVMLFISSQLSFFFFFPYPPHSCWSFTQQTWHFLTFLVLKSWGLNQPPWNKKPSKSCAVTAGSAGWMLGWRKQSQRRIPCNSWQRGYLKLLKLPLDDPSSLENCVHTE